MSLRGFPSMADVKKPDKDGPLHSAHAKKDKTHWSHWKTLGVLGLVLTLIFFSAFFTLNIRDSAKNIYQGFKDLTYDITGLGSAGFESSLDIIEQDIDSLGKKAQLLSLIPQLREIPGVLGDLKEVISIVANLGNVFSEVRQDGLSLALNGEGDKLLNALKIMRFDIVRLGEVSEGLVEKTNKIGPYEHEFNAITDNLSKLGEGLDAIVSFLDIPEERKIVLLFENHSELRPSGGFAGSYGELTLLGGGLESMEVNDIYYPDKFLKKKVIPPLQLQGITPNWGSRDTNWFFDFSESSKKLIQYLEESDIYKSEGISFNGVISINVRVVEDMLRLTGPIVVPEYDLTLSQSNFLRTIQEQVVEDRAPGQNPKEVLKFAVPALIEKLNQLEDKKKSQLVDVLIQRTRNKDIKLYFKEARMQKMASDINADGKEYKLNEDFAGDYLAVVNANVAGGKTDVFVSQSIALESVISAEGRVQNKLSVLRRHSGGKEPEYFYNQTNQNFIRIFTVPEASITYIKGGVKKEVVPLRNYVGSDYTVDGDLSELEGTRSVLSVPLDNYVERYFYAGKSIFGTWFNIEPGESRVLELRYSGQNISLVDGQIYSFVLDKQSGSESSFEYSVLAPEGFVWKETNNVQFIYQERSIPTRIEISLTLKKN